MTNKKYIRRYLNLAKHVASWSKDPSTQVGAVITNDLNIVVGLGYNGFPRGVHDCSEQLADRSQKYPRIVHAEVNAILNANAPVRGCSLFVWPLPPCNECTKFIIQAGIKDIYAPELPENSRWLESTQIANSMLIQAEIPCFLFPVLEADSPDHNIPDNIN